MAARTVTMARGTAGQKEGTSVLLVLALVTSWPWGGLGDAGDVFRRRPEHSHGEDDDRGHGIERERMGKMEGLTANSMGWSSGSGTSWWRRN